MGSSIVRMCSERVWLARSIRQASVVDLPEPVGPVTSTIPRGSAARSSIVGVIPSVSGSGILELMTRMADSTPPGSAIVTSVNIDQVRITGIEGVVEIRPKGPVSAYVNVALNHAYGYGAITGGFFPAVPPAGTFDLDHDQRLSGGASLVYSAQGFYLSATGIYGSGLTNGADPDATYGTGLLDFNKSIKVPSSFILNASAGYAFAAGRVVLRPQTHAQRAL